MSSFKLRASARSIDESTMLIVENWAQSRSKDPSTKVGACVYDPTTGGVFLGYNGFPPNVPEREEWWTNREEVAGKLCKYDLVVHAEVNAVRKALVAGVKLATAVLYCTHLPCPRCMRDVICANGIKSVHYKIDEYASLTPRARWVVHQLAEMGGVTLSKMESKS
jgi:dCMP deaminase